MGRAVILPDAASSGTLSVEGMQGNSRDEEGKDIVKRHHLQVPLHHKITSTSLPFSSPSVPCRDADEPVAFHEGVQEPGLAKERGCDAVFHPDTDILLPPPLGGDIFRKGRFHGPEQGLFQAEHGIEERADDRDEDDKCRGRVAGQAEDRFFCNPADDRGLARARSRSRG